MNETYRRHLMQGERAGVRYTLAVPRNVSSGLAGAQMSHRAGSSLEFMDHREYQPGDDLRRVNWSAFARSDRLIVTLYREEVSPHLDIVLDGSRSMALDQSAKAQAALGLGAVFAAAAANAAYSHCAWITRGGCAKVGNGAGRPSVWEGIAFDDRASPADSFQKLPPAWRPRGIRALVSDLLWLGDPLQTLWRFADRAAAVVIVQVVAQADVDPPERGNIRLVDSESGEVMELFLDALAERRYREAFARHQQNWHRAARQVGAVMTTVTAENVVRDWDLADLVAAQVLEVA